MSLQPSYTTAQPTSSEHILLPHDTRLAKVAAPSGAKPSLARTDAGSKSTSRSKARLPLSSSIFTRDSEATGVPRSHFRGENKGDSLRCSPRPPQGPPNSHLGIWPTSKPPPSRAASFVGSRLPIPSQISNESGILGDGARRVLRRKAPFVQRSVSSIARSEADQMLSMEVRDERLRQHSSKCLLEGFHSSVSSTPCLGIQSDEMLSTIPATIGCEESTSVLIPELRALATATGVGPAAFSSPHLPLAASPSTQYSSSAGPWSSRDTTPTSASSCSPGVVHLSKDNPPSQHLREESKALTTDATVPGYKASSKMPERSTKITLSGHTGKQDDGDDDQRFLRRTQKLKSSSSPTPAPSPKWSVMKASLPPPHEKVRDPADCDPWQVIPLNAAKPQSIVASVDEAIARREPPVRPRRNSTVDLPVEPRTTVQSTISSRSLRHIPRRQLSNRADQDKSTHRVHHGRVQSDVSQSAPFSDDRNLANPRLQEQPIAPAVLTKRPTRTSTKNPTNRSLTNSEAENRQVTNEPERSTLGRLSARLGISGRRRKIVHEDTASIHDSESRKCPAAGTGHEGYGKYARRGRKFSGGSASSSRDRSTSSTGSGSPLSPGRLSSRSSRVDSDIDDFVAQRLHPVVITGGHRHASESEGDASTTQHSFTRRPWNSEPSLALDNPVSNEQVQGPANKLQSPSATPAATNDPSPTVRCIGSASPLRATPHVGTQTSLPLFDTNRRRQSSFMREDLSATVVGHPAEPATLRQTKRADRGGKLFPWNVFQSNESVERTVPEIEEPFSDSSRSSVVVGSMSADRSIPYYALVDSDNENDGEQNLQELLEEVQQAQPPVVEVESEQDGSGPRQLDGQPCLLPVNPLVQPLAVKDANLTRQRPPQRANDQAAWITTTPPPQSSEKKLEKKPNRLPHVGRIPQVISRRDRQHTPPVASFSRPFQRSDLVDNAKLSRSSPGSNRERQRNIPNIQTDVFQSQPFPDPERGQSRSAPVGYLGARPFENLGSFPESFSVPSRGGYEGGAESSSVKGLLPIIASARTHHYHEQHEVWDEYDDLLDEIVSSDSTDAAYPVPYGLGRESTRATADWRREGRPESHLRQGTGYQKWQREAPTEAPSAPLPRCPISEGMGMEYSQLQSRTSSALISTSPVTPLSPFSIADYSHAGAETGNRDSARLSRGSNAGESRVLRASADGIHSGLLTLPEASRYRNTALLDVAERDHESPTGQSDLRFAALMTSRWLSFGRVLFSPAHEIVENNPSQQILVIDGLGNDDWSFYCATTYPRATVHALKETDTMSGSRAKGSNSPEQAPSNHRRVQLPHLAVSFPFPPSFFSAIVFRFPAAMSDSILKMALSECKRVLAPGGYIEFSLLDLDIVNMGTLTRRAVRDLKARMISADPQVSLKPVSDNVQSILGQRGFENLNRCTVGVPVDGKASSPSGSRSSRSSRDSYRPREPTQSDAVRGESACRSSDSDPDACLPRPSNFALNELILDHSATSDEKITRMVAKVGRWWYTRTYESAVLPGGDLQRSIWSNKKMLRECKARGSGFKLLIAYAQSPTEPRRRTMSEPTKSTTATSGVEKTVRGEYKMKT